MNKTRVRPGTVVTLAVLVLLAVVYILPFLIDIANSFKSEAESSAHPLGLVPETITLAAYQRLFQADFPTWFMNSIVVAVAVTAGRVFFSSLAGYALSRLHFRGRGVIFAGVVGVLAVPPVVLLIPKFLVINQLGMYDSYSGMIVPLLADAASIFIMKGFFESIPLSVEEAATIDGASIFRRFWSVVLPMARPAVITVFILSFQASWNELSHFIISAQDPRLNTLTKGVAQLASGQLSAGTQYPIKLAAALIMTIPVTVLFLIFQKRIMNSTAGSVKE
jgi:multiple sugar transport system permease protein